MENTDINAAADLVRTVEVEALEAIRKALTTLETSLSKIEATLPNAITLDARRIVGELRSSLTYRREAELPAIVARYNPPEAAQPDA